MHPNLAPLETTDELATKFIARSILNEFKFLVMHTGENKFIELTQSQLQIIQNAHPKKIDVYFEKSNFSAIVGGTPINIAHRQSINHSMLYLDKDIREKYLKKFNGLIETPEQTDLANSKYWNSLSQLTAKAVKKYPLWKKSRASKRKPFKTTELTEWIESLGANTREAEIIKKALSDFFEELQ